MQGDVDRLRLRALAALAILVAGITLGFTLGRMSVWLVGFDGSNHDAVAHEGNTNRSMRETTPVVSAPAPNIAAPAAGSSPKLVLPPPSAAAPSGPGSPASAPQTSPAPEPAPSTSAAVPQEPPKPVLAPNWRAAYGDGASAGNGTTEDNLPGPSVRLINPRQDEAPRVAAEPDAAGNAAEIETDRQGIAACERRYSSFRRNDGTYQPYGGGPRQRCPLLR
jgi:BA14K-like protein